jgi:hypothetical protein
MYFLGMLIYSVHVAFLTGCVSRTTHVSKLQYGKPVMKLVDMDTVFLVHSGEPWLHSQPPCSRPMIQFLERNEGLVSWVQVLRSFTAP